MRKFAVIFLCCCLFFAGAAFTGAHAAEKEEIVIGSPFPLDFLYGWTPYRAMQLAVEEINAKGGVNVGGKKCR